MSTKVEINRIAGDTCITLEQGEPVFRVIQPLLKSGETVMLDFSGVAVCASPFLNAAVGRLLKDFEPQELERLLVIDNITPIGLRLLRKVIENSNRFYRDPAARKALEDILNEETDSTDGSEPSDPPR